MSLKKNFIYNTLYQIFNIFTPFITAPYLSRILEPEGIGIQSYTASVQSYFLLVAVLGTAGYGVREISQNRDSKIKYSKLFWEIEFLTFFTAGFSLLVWLIFCIFVNTYRTIYFVMSINLIASMLDITWLYNGLEKFKLTVLRGIFLKILGIILIFTLIKSHDDLMIYILINAVVNVISAVSLWITLPTIVFIPKWSELKILRHFKETLVFFLPNVATSIYLVLDKTLLGLIVGDASQNGYYEQSEKILNILKSVTYGSLSTVVGVRMSYLFSKNRLNEVKEKINYSLNYMFFIGMGLIFGTWSVAEDFVPLFFGKGYNEVSSLLKMFVPIIVIIGISNIAGTHYFVPVGRISETIKYLIAGSLSNLLLNLVLIPKYVARGAVIASLVAEFVVTILFVKNINGFMNWREIFANIWKKIVSGSLMFLILNMLNGLLNKYILLQLIIKIMFGIIIYVVILLIMKDTWCMNRKNEVKERLRLWKMF